MTWKPKLHVFVETAPAQIEDRLPNMTHHAPFGILSLRRDITLRFSIGHVMIQGSPMRCQFLKDGELHWTINPTFHVNENFKPGSCRYKATIKALKNRLTEATNKIYDRISYVQEPALAHAQTSFSKEPLTSTEAVAEQYRLRQELKTIVEDSVKRVMEDLTNRMAELKKPEMNCP